jgi:type VI secretion system secreted protein VgrG
MSITHDFTFAWEHAEGSPWAHLQVVRFHGHEEISALYRYELTLLAREPNAEVDLGTLVGARATLRIATLSQPAYRLVHGVIAEAEEIGAVPEGLLYRAVLAPPLVRARHRTRCRIFLEKTLRQIINAVLQGDPELRRDDGCTVVEDDGIRASFKPAAEVFAWRLGDPARIDDAAARPYCVQYNESDLAFVSRLLEEEGIGYHFEHGEGVCLLVLSDGDQGKARIEPQGAFGPGVAGRSVRTLKLGARLRERAVRLGDYDWRKPALRLSAEARDPGDLFEQRWPGGFPHDAPEQGTPLAQARLDRFRSESAYATGEGAARVLSAGSVFAVDLPEARYDGEYLATKIDVRGEQHGVASVASSAGAAPFACVFECARRGAGDRVEESRFRPALSTPRPRILGSQTAFVTADPQATGAEIHVGGPKGAEIGCVRLRFHWDTETARLAREPSSEWVRVSQAFAGVGEGAVFHPRVGVEVIVEFLDGDPDHPLVTGRVYNGANRPPAAANGAATVSIFKSFASPGGAVHNEFGFDDTAGSEQVKMHAGKDWNSTVGHDRSEKVANNSTSAVSVDRSESTGSNRNATVGADDSLAVGANRSVSVGANRAESVSGNASVTVAGTDSTTVAGARTVTVSGAMTSVIAGAVGLHGGADMTMTSGATMALSAAANINVVAGAAASFVAGGEAVVQGATVHVTAAGEIVLSAGGCSIKISGCGVEINGGPVKIAGSSVDITGGLVKLN